MASMASMGEEARYDVVVVGARCAGASLAAYLARGGARVLLLDKDGLPSDQVLSTHTVRPRGLDVLDELGVGDAVRRVTPPARRICLAKSGARLDVTHAPGRADYCPRRKRLDGLLQDAAVAAGAELLDRTRVTALVRDGDRVAGVRATQRGQERVFRADLVVGADGRHSTVAREARAEEYLGYDAPRAMYWAYWGTPSFWWEDASYPFDLYVGKTGRDARVIFQTDDDQLLMGGLPPVDEVAPWRRDPLGTLRAHLAADPVTGPLVEGQEPDGPVRGTIKERYFFRRGVGSGWALVGDAGHHKDFVLGDGITEALLQARGLAAAIAEGTELALRRWWRRRDVEALPLFFFAQDEGAADPPPELQRIVFARLADRPELRARMARAMDHEISPYEALPVPTILRWTAAAALRRPDVLADFARMGRRAAQVAREQKQRERLLAEAS